MKQCCIDGCNNNCEIGRRYCHEHYLQRKREQAKERYAQHGNKKYPCICTLCNKPFQGDKKNSKFCSRECYYKYSRINSSNASNNYERAHGGGYSFAHRRIAEQLLKRKLTRDEVIHHIDGNPTNNDTKNLIILSRKDHVKLHSILTKERTLLLKKQKENLESCWNNIRYKITTTWLKTNNINVIKISDINKSEK